MAKGIGKNGLAVGLIAAGSITLAALGFFASTPDARRVPQEQHRTTHDPLQVDVVPDRERDKVTTLKPRVEDTDLKFDATKVTPPAGVDPKVFVVNEYLKYIDAAPGAKANSVTVRDGIATVDFNSELQAGMSSMDEGTVVNGILAALGTFKDVEAVQFTVNGQPIETLGHIDLTEPQPVTRLDPGSN